jgi:hypothetical protein
MLWLIELSPKLIKGVQYEATVINLLENVVPFADTVNGRTE